MILATLLIATLLQVFQPKIAFADEGDPGTGTNDPNPPVNPPSWIKLTAVSDPDGTHANLTVTTDVNAENSSSTVSLYRTNDLANAVAQWTSGKVNISQVNRPLTGYAEYVAKVNSLTSNSAAVTNTTDGWSADLSVSADQFSTADASPQLTWTSSQPLTSTTKLFIYDQTTNSLLSVKTSGGTGTLAVRPLDGATHIYKAYVSTDANNAASESSLQGIVSATQTVATGLTPWVVSLTADKTEFSTDDVASPTLTWTVNQPVDDARDGNKYAVLFADLTTSTVLSVYNSTSLTGSTQVRFNRGAPHRYAAYVARYTGGGYSPDLSWWASAIVTSSQTVDIARSAWTITLDIDKTQYSTDETVGSKLTWTTNQTISDSNYYDPNTPQGAGDGDTHAVFLADPSTGKVLSSLYNTGKTGSQTYRSMLPTSQSFVAYVIDYTTGNGVPSQILPNDPSIEARSQIVTTQRKPWTVSLEVNKSQFSTDDPRHTLTWTTNQTVSDSHYWEPNTPEGAGDGDNYAVFIANAATGAIADCPFNVGKTGTYQPNFTTGPGRTYIAYLSKYTTGNGCPTNVSALAGIEASSASVYAERTPWTISLAAAATVTSATTKSVALTWTTNQSVSTSTSGAYAIYLFDATTGADKGRFGYHPNAKTDTLSSSVPLSNSDSYIAYVAAVDDSGGIMTVSRLRDIQAISNGASADTSGPSYSGESKSGSNSNEAYCGQCHADPIDAYSGTFFENDKDMSVSTGLPFEFTRSYSSSDASKNGSLGYGWSYNYQMNVALAATQASGTALKDANQITVSAENGALTPFNKMSDGTYLAPVRVLAGLAYDSVNNRFVFTRNNGYKFYFADSDGRLLKIADRNGNQLALTYTGGLLQRIAANDGKYIDLSYDSTNSHIISVKDNNSRTVTYGYDASGNMASASSLTATNPTNYGYDSAHQLTTIGLPTGSSTVYNTTTNTYVAGQVTKQTRPDAKFYQFAYTASTSTQGQITTVTNPDSTVTRDEYNFMGQLVKETVAYGTSDAAVTQRQYGATGQLTQVIDPENHITNMTYDASGNLLNSVDPLSRKTEFTYNTFNQLLTTKDALGHTAKNTYDANGNLLKSEDFEGNMTKYVINSNGTVKSIESPNDVAKDTTNPKTEFEYDTNGFLKSSSDPRGNVSTTSMNALGQPAWVKNAQGYGPTYSYDSLKRLRQSTTARGGVSTINYDGAGRVLSTVDALNRTTNYTYDSLNNVKTAANSTANSKITYTYDAMNRVTVEVQANYADNTLLRTIFYAYDKRGNLGSTIVSPTTFQSGRTTTNTYYLNDLLKTSRDPSGVVTTYSYDANGNVTQISTRSSDSSLTVTSSATYDELNRLKTSTNSDGASMAYEYDNNGRTVKVTRNDNSVLKTAYDANGNVIKTTAADNSHRDYGYDSADNLISQKDESGAETTYSYDSVNKAKQVSRPDGTSAYYTYYPAGELKQTSYNNWQTIDSSYSYRSSDGQPSQEVKGSTTTAYAYDANGNLTYRGPPTQNGNTAYGVSYTYDVWQQLASETYPGGASINYAYTNAFGELNVVRKGTASPYVTYSRNSTTGQVTTATYGNGVKQTYGYDKLNRNNLITIQQSGTSSTASPTPTPTGAATPTPTSTVSAVPAWSWSKQLTLSPGGLIQSQSTSTSGTNSSGATVAQTYGYDDLKRLSSVSQDSATSSLALDSRGNLTANGADANTYNPVGEIQSSANAATHTATAYSYSARGNRTQADVSETTDPASPTPVSSTAYSWTPDDKLASVSTTNASYGYGYGADGLLASKSTSITGSTAPPSTESYVWDKNTSVPTLLEDSANSYLYADDSTPFAQINKSTGAIKYLYQDDLGSVVVTADGFGNQTSQYSYDAYGKTTTARGDTVAHDISPFAYAGEYLDKTVGLYYLRARWYDPNAASFLSLDPLINKTGDAYSYGGGNPLSLTDPLGLDAWRISGPFANSFAGNVINGISGLAHNIATAGSRINTNDPYASACDNASGLAYKRALVPAADPWQYLTGATSASELGIATMAISLAAGGRCRPINGIMACTGSHGGGGTTFGTTFVLSDGDFDAAVEPANFNNSDILANKNTLNHEKRHVGQFQTLGVLTMTIYYFDSRFVAGLQNHRSKDGTYANDQYGWGACNVFEGAAGFKDGHYDACVN